MWETVPGRELTLFQGAGAPVWGEAGTREGAISEAYLLPSVTKMVNKLVRPSAHEAVRAAWGTSLLPFHSGETNNPRWSEICPEWGVSIPPGAHFSFLLGQILRDERVFAARSWWEEWKEHCPRRRGH